jgi:predicted DNA-binding protein with PD1-like motif
VTDVSGKFHPSVDPVVLRLQPGADLRRTLEEEATQRDGSWVLISGIGSLERAMLRYAGAAAATPLPGPLEVLSLAGTVCADGAHLHALLADATGTPRGGHVAAGCIVATTAELTLLPLRDTRLRRVHDAETGFTELDAAPPID